MEKKWEPWKEFKQPVDILKIDGPPCPGCKNWQPHRQYRGIVFCGVQMCVSENMCSDFSCFEKKEDVETPSK